MTSPSAYVSRCLETLAEYQRLRFLGTSHEAAVSLSGFRDAVIGKETRVQADSKMAQAGKDSE